VRRALLVAAILAYATGAFAWEAQTTHAGLVEQAALASKLHRRLETLGFTGGLFEPLTIPPADAPALIADLKLLSPSQGAVPDARGRQTALAWLAAGAALADVPATSAANHFFDVDATPGSGGWTRPPTSVADNARHLQGRAQLPAHGVPAPDWVVSKQNPMNLAAFLDRYAKAVGAATPGERSRHMAAALVAAGAMLHVLGDLGAPARVRGDYAAQLEPLGGGSEDLGSRVERIAALAYGRLGVPPASRVITRAKLRDYYTELATEIAHGYFSPHTLPHDTHMGGGEIRPQVARPLPALPQRLNLMAASRSDGTTLRDAAGTCLARYRTEHATLSFSLDDDCLLEQVTAILPEVASYEAGLLDYLLRGELTIDIGAQLVVAGKDLGAGSLQVFVEDERGVRSMIGETQGASAKLAVPTNGTRVVAVFRGADKNGEPVVAVGAMPLESSK
jgi:hypothetical protein